MPGAASTATKMYVLNLRRFLEPAWRCDPAFSKSRNADPSDEPVLNPQLMGSRDYLFRCLDRGRNGGFNSGYGRAEANQSSSTTVPHIWNILKTHVPQEDTGSEFISLLKGEEAHRHWNYFAVKRLMELCEEKEIVWERGRMPDRDGPMKRKPNPDQADKELLERGHFPFVDEQASLIDELALKDILRVRHKTNRRRQPYWIEYQYQHKQKHQQYLRRREMLKDEAKARLGLQTNQR